MGPDGLPVHVFKYGGDVITNAVNDTAIQSMEEGVVPSQIKLGWITPIWKGEDSSNPINYRPISLTSHLSKVIERVIRMEMTVFLDRHNLIEDTHYGSRHGRG